MKRTGAIVITLATFIFASTAFSQHESSEKLKEREKDLMEEKIKESETKMKEREKEQIEKIEMLKMWKLIETLDMGEEQAQKFFILIKRQNDGERKSNRERHEIEKQLKISLGKEPVPEDELKKLIRNFVNNQDEARLNRKKFYEESSGILSTEQQAKLILFQSRFNREMFEIMKEIRQKKQIRKR